MRVEITETQEEKSRILALSPEALFEQDILKEIVETGFYLSIIYDPYDHATIREVSIPLSPIKKAA